MGESKARLVRTVRLEFPSDDREKPVRDNLSAVAASDDHLWFGTDEGTLLDRLTATGGDRYAGHVAFDLKEWLKLPNTSGKKDEIDIEGLCVAGNHLWLVGSHAATRDKPDPKKDGPRKAIKELEDTDERPNRWTLARFELGDLGSTLGAAAQLPITKDASPLLEALAEDPHLRPFLKIPAKENGFDVEGLAVAGERLFLGLRGPVLRGWAVLLELEVKLEGAGLELEANGPDGRRYRKHFLDLQGCGLRDLCLETSGRPSLLLLAGPSMALDGAVRVHRWTLPDMAKSDSITASEGCPALIEIPHGEGKDRAEGMELIGERRQELLVVYDSPKASRAPKGKTDVDADVFALPGRKGKGR